METKVKRPRLANAKKLSLEYPDTFSYWEEDIAALKVGDIVKVSGNERFWVIVKEINGDKIIGEVNNLLLNTTTYNLGDWISFKRENIYQFWDDSMKPLD